MNKYQKLIGNSLIFALGNLGNKLMSFLLVPLFTYTMTRAQYGVADILSNTTLLLLPIITLGINDSLVKFIIDDSGDKVEIVSNSTILLLFGFVIGILVIPISYLMGIPIILCFLLYLNIITSALQNFLANYIRAIGLLKIYAFNSILYAFSVLVFSLAFLITLNLNVIGVISAQVFGSLISIIFLLFKSDIIKLVSLSNINMFSIKKLVKFAAPLIPNNTIFWLINTVSRYTILFFVGATANGLYAVAMKIPGLVNLFSMIFSQAWQMSAIEEKKTNMEEKQKFFSNIFISYSLIQYFGVSIILLLLKPMTRFLFAKEFYDSWTLVPLLLMGAIYASLNGFFGQIYIAENKTVGMLKTTIFTGIISIIANITLVAWIGILGATVSQLFGWLMSLIYRIYDTKKIFSFNIRLKFHVKNHFLLILQILSNYIISNYFINIGIQVTLLTGLLLFNLKEIKNLRVKGAK